MDNVIEGRVWVFGDSVDTDNMYPGFAMKLPIEEAAKHIFYDLRPGWTDEVQPGDIVVAGQNFGVGSSRPVALLFQQLGVAALIADEFNSLFLRNCTNFGLLAATVPGAATALSDGDRIRLDVAAATVARLNGDPLKLTGQPLPEFVLDIVAGGGLFPMLREQGYIAA